MPSRRKQASRPGAAAGSLSRGRPPVFGQRPLTLSAKTSRKLIRSHHDLQKQKARALAEGDAAAAQKIDTQIETEGGLKMYQQASKIGQANERGGDSSRVLCDWLEPIRETIQGDAGHRRLRMLEVGALSEQNACSRLGLFDMTRIDLQAQSAHIQQEDFMERPRPPTDEQRFDIISLSLVLNYVPDPVGRGDMLQRTTDFLRTRSSTEKSMDFFPSLFLVFPAPCITNSRYLTEERLQEIMGSLGYTPLKRKQSSKLLYYLWRYDAAGFLEDRALAKVELNPGKRRNNFAIVRR